MTLINSDIIWLTIECILKCSSLFMLEIPIHLEAVYHSGILYAYIYV